MNQKNNLRTRVWWLGKEGDASDEYYLFFFFLPLLNSIVCGTQFKNHGKTQLAQLFFILWDATEPTYITVNFCGTLPVHYYICNEQLVCRQSLEFE